MAQALRVAVLAAVCSVVPLVAPHTVTAAPITFEFTSTVVSVEHAFLGVQPGDAVVGRYVFESTTPATPSSPPDPTSGRYHPAGTFEVTFGLLTLSLPLDLIEVLNRPDLDRYTVAALSGTGNGALQLQLVLPTTQHLNAFTNVDLPLVPPQLGLFENTQFIVFVSQGPSNFIQQITASPIQTLRLVPEPGTLMLLGLSMVSLLGVARLRSPRKSGDALRFVRRPGSADRSRQRMRTMEDRHGAVGVD